MSIHFQGVVEGSILTLERFQKALETRYDYDLTKEAAANYIALKHELKTSENELIHRHSTKMLKQLFKTPNSYVNYPAFEHFTGIQSLSNVKLTITDKENNLGLLSFEGISEYPLKETLVTLDTFLLDHFLHQEHGHFKYITLQDFLDCQGLIIGTSEAAKFKEIVLIRNHQVNYKIEPL